MGTEIGLLNLRRSAFIDAPPARVWLEFTTAERIAGWLNRGHVLHKIDPLVGGEVLFSVTPDGAEEFFGGKIVVVEPNRELTLAVNWQSPEMAWPADTFWTFRLTPCYGGTLVELFHHGFERLGEQAGEALLGYEWGWDVKHLAALREIVTATA